MPISSSNMNISNIKDSNNAMAFHPFNDDLDLVSRWLTAANLSYAIPNFQMAGIVSPRSFAELQLNYFEPLGVTKPEDRKRLFYLIQKVKGEIEKKENSKSNKVQRKSSNLKQQRGDDNDGKGNAFQSPVIASKGNVINANNVNNHANSHRNNADNENDCGDQGNEDYDDVFVSTVGGSSDAISPVTLSSQIASLSEEIHHVGYQNYHCSDGGDIGRENKVGTSSSFKSSSVLTGEENHVYFETDGSKKKLTAREQLEKELEMRASKRREQKLMDQQHQQQEELSTTSHSIDNGTTTSSTGGGGGGVTKKRRQSLIPSVRSTGGGGSNSSIVDVRSRRSSVGIHRRETVRKTNTTLSVAAGGRRGVKNEEEEVVDMSETSDLSNSVSSYHSLEFAARLRSSNHRRNSNASASTMGMTSANGGGGGGSDDGGINSSASRMDENRNGNVVMKDTKKSSSLVNGGGVGGNSGMKSSSSSAAASHSSRSKRLSTIPSSMIAPLSPLVEFSSTHLDESMAAKVVPRNPVRRRSSLGGGMKPSSSSSSARSYAISSVQSQKKLVGSGAKSPGSTTSSTSYPSRPSSRTSVDGSHHHRGNNNIHKLNVSHSANNTSVLSSSSSVASSVVRRRRQHLMSPTNVRSKVHPSRSKSPIPSSSQSSVRSQQQRSVLSTTRSRTSPTPTTSSSYATSSSPKRHVTPKKKLTPPKSSGLIGSNTIRRPLSPIRNSPAMLSRAASPMSARKGKSPIGGGSAFYNSNNNDSVVGFHLGTTEETSWAAQIGRLRESFEREHVQHLSTTHDHLTTTADDDNEDDMRIRVIVRKRPMSKRESSDGSEVDVVQPLVYNDYGRILIHQPKTKLDLTKEVETTSFAFDNAFDELSNNSDIYEKAVQSLIPGLFRGKWASVFAYGQTGSGKTFTMMGSNATGMRAGNQAENNITSANLGLYYLAAQDVFRIAEDPAHAGISIGVSLFEIYGGKLLDLLNARNPVRCLEDSRGKVCFPGLSEHPVNSADELMQIIDAGALNRSTGTTSANADSSRSHAVLQLSLRKDSKRGRNVEHGRLTFIDLAGSERGADTSKACRTTRLEGAEINTSLLALKEVIRALATGSSMNRIPFRGSKLTQVLKESFVGKNSRTVMVSCVAPNMKNCDHTLNTLRYADRVKERDPLTGKLSSSVVTSHKIKRDKADIPLLHRPLTAPAASFRDDRDDESSDDNDIPPPPPPSSSNNEIPTHSLGEDDFSDDEAGRTLNSEFDSLDEALKSHDNLSVSQTNEPTISRKSNASNAAQTLIATHKTVMSKLLQMLQHEMTLVNDTDTNRENIDEYMKELEHLSDQQLVLLSTLGESLESYNVSRSARGNNTGQYDDSFEVDLRE